MLNPGQWWIFKRLASILWERLPYSTQTSFTFQRLIPLLRENGIFQCMDTSEGLIKCRKWVEYPFMVSLFALLNKCLEETKKTRVFIHGCVKLKVVLGAKGGKCAHGMFFYRQPPGLLSHLSEAQNCLNPNWWFLNTILAALERVTYGKSIRQLILKTKTWQVHLLINGSVGGLYYVGHWSFDNN